MQKVDLWGSHLPAPLVRLVLAGCSLGDWIAAQRVARSWQLAVRDDDWRSRLLADVHPSEAAGLAQTEAKTAWRSLFRARQLRQRALLRGPVDVQWALSESISLKPLQAWPPSDEFLSERAGAVEVCDLTTGKALLTAGALTDCRHLLLRASPDTNERFFVAATPKGVQLFDAQLKPSRLLEPGDAKAWSAGWRDLRRFDDHGLLLDACPYSGEAIACLGDVTWRWSLKTGEPLPVMSAEARGKIEAETIGKGNRPVADSRLLSARLGLLMCLESRRLQTWLMVWDLRARRLRHRIPIGGGSVWLHWPQGHCAGDLGGSGWVVPVLVTHRAENQRAVPVAERVMGVCQVWEVSGGRRLWPSDGVKAAAAPEDSSSVAAAMAAGDSKAAESKRGGLPFALRELGRDPSNCIVAACERYLVCSSKFLPVEPLVVLEMATGRWRTVQLPDRKMVGLAMAYRSVALVVDAAAARVLILPAEQTGRLGVLTMQLRFRPEPAVA